MAEGQFTGTRSQYVYTNDGGGKYVLLLDDTLATLTGTGLTAYDPANPGGATPPPRRFKPRIVYWQGTQADFTTKRKALVCGTTSGTLYTSVASQTLTIDGVAGKTTGRRGEKLTF